MTQTLADRIRAPGPKKILSCDGGGILGLISVEILSKLEADLRARTGKPDLLLGQWFDFVCGTSTGAIIAACIAAGMSMERIRTFYIESGQQTFDKASLFRRLQYSYNDEPLARKLRDDLENVHGQVATVDKVRADLLWLADIEMVATVGDAATITERGKDVVLDRSPLPGGV